MVVVCKWCQTRKGILPDSGVLLCPRCDYTEVGGPPDENRVKDVPL